MSLYHAILISRSICCICDSRSWSDAQLSSSPDWVCFLTLSKSCCLEERSSSTGFRLSLITILVRTWIWSFSTLRIPHIRPNTTHSLSRINWKDLSWWSWVGKILTNHGFKTDKRVSWPGSIVIWPLEVSIVSCLISSFQMVHSSDVIERCMKVIST